MDSMREDMLVESKMRDDYDYCYEKIVLESDELFLLQQVVRDLGDKMAEYGWEDDKTTKDIIDEI